MGDGQERTMSLFRHPLPASSGNFAVLAAGNFAGRASAIQI